LKNVARLKGEFNQHHRHNYGQPLILNAGGGYHVLLGGMERYPFTWASSEPIAEMDDNRPLPKRAV